MRAASALTVVVAVFGLNAGAFAKPAFQTRGKIVVAADMSLAAVATDPVLQQILNDDFDAAGRGLHGNTKVATLTVTVTQRALRPGVSLEELVPGDPGVVAMLRAAGATPPPVGDTGAAQENPYETLAKMQALRPDSPAIQQLKEERVYDRMAGMPGAGSPMRPRSAADQGYDTVIVARVSADGHPERFTVVAVAHPGDDLREVKKLMGEQIANALLH